MLIDFIVGVSIAINAVFIAYAADAYLTEEQIMWAPLILAGASIIALVVFFLTNDEDKQ